MLALAASLPGSRRYRPATPPRHHRQKLPPPPPLLFAVPTFHHSGPKPGSDGRVLPFPWRGSHSLPLPARLVVTDSSDASATDCEVIACFVVPDPDDLTSPPAEEPIAHRTAKNIVRLFGFCHPEYSKWEGKKLFFSYFGPSHLREQIRQPM